MKRISILGSTGSIGLSTLDVISMFPDDFDVVALAAGRNIEALAAQIRLFQPDVVSVAEASGAEELRSRLQHTGHSLPEIAYGPDGATQVAAYSESDLVLTAMVGAIGLNPTLAAIHCGKEIAIANKEPLVAAGQLCTAAAKRSGAVLLPVDSEHNAIYQCLRREKKSAVRRLLLTCSGGPFINVADLASVTREEALNHPTWTMGPKITIDSATLMNKGLEVIEARWLFDIDSQAIEIIIHPQSVVHSMVEFVDGSLLAQLGTPDMRVPIGYALGFPERFPLQIPKLDLLAICQLTFEKPDFSRFRCAQLAYDALAIGGTAPAVLNASNEVAVAAFLDRGLRLIQIPEVIERTIGAHEPMATESLDIVIEADTWARTKAEAVIKEIA